MRHCRGPRRRRYNIAMAFTYVVGVAPVLVVASAAAAFICLFACPYRSVVNIIVVILVR